MLVLYVDDLLISGNNRARIEYIILEFSRRLKMKNIDVATEFLGIKLSRDSSKKTLHLSQADYADKIIERFSMNGSDPVPIRCNHQDIK